LQLPWAQEASGSNPDAPTKLFNELPTIIVFAFIAMEWKL
jgi:hypothetical protein